MGCTKEKQRKKMKYTDLRDFISQLQQSGELKRISTPVSPYLEMTEICDRTLRASGPAIISTMSLEKISLYWRIFSALHVVSRSVWGMKMSANYVASVIYWRN